MKERVKERKPISMEERIYRAVRRHMMPYRIFPDPKPTIIKAIKRAMAVHR